MEQKSKVYLIIFVVVGLVIIGGVALAYQQGWFKSSADITQKTTTSPSSSSSDIENKINSYMATAEAKDLVKSMAKTASQKTGSPVDIGNTIIANLRKMIKDPDECHPYLFKGEYGITIDTDCPKPSPTPNTNKKICIEILIFIDKSEPEWNFYVDENPPKCIAVPSGHSLTGMRYNFIYDPINDTLTPTNCFCGNSTVASGTFGDKFKFVPDRCCGPKPSPTSATPSTSANPQ